MNTTWGRARVNDLLKVDPFSEQMRIIEAPGSKPVTIMDKDTFFGEVYSSTVNRNLQIMDGSRRETITVDFDQWRQRDLKKTSNSVVILLEGYAGCGKSVFVQNLLRLQLGTTEYDYNYYDYDLGAYLHNANSHRIEEAIRECLLDQMIKDIINNKMTIINQFKKLLNQDEITLLDTGRMICYQLTRSKAFEDAICSFDIYDDFEEAKANFRALLNAQMERFSLVQIIAIDFLFRLAKYITEKNAEESVLYVCYDNLDAIENFEELTIFDDTLFSMRRNIDIYISETERNYTDMALPRFVIIATYRKITAARVGLTGHSERCEDYFIEDKKYVQYIEASHFYSYKNIIKRRKDFFERYFKENNVKEEFLLDQLSKSLQLFNTEFVCTRYAGLWNNNYRTCSDVMDAMLSKYGDDIQRCLELSENKRDENKLRLSNRKTANVNQTQESFDGYDKLYGATYGASAIFLNVACKVFKNNSIWDTSHMNLVPFEDYYEGKPAAKMTSLSRLILTYMINHEDSAKDSTSLLEIFDVFSGLFSSDDICSCLANMLLRDESGTWRRPIYYFANAIKDNGSDEIITFFKNQWMQYQNNNRNYNYTQLAVCECGKVYIARIVMGFEFFSVRVGNRCSLYCINSLYEQEKAIDAVLQAVTCCCQNMQAFNKLFVNKMYAYDEEKYLDSDIHPRTGKTNQPQLHTERIIFSHVGYLDYCRRFWIQRAKEDSAKVNGLYIRKMKKYLDLYNTYILPEDSRRKMTAEDLQAQCNKLENAKDLKIMMQPIRRKNN